MHCSLFHSANTAANTRAIFFKQKIISNIVSQNQIFRLSEKLKKGLVSSVHTAERSLFHSADFVAFFHSSQKQYILKNPNQTKSSDNQRSQRRVSSVHTAERRLFQLAENYTVFHLTDTEVISSKQIFTKPNPQTIREAKKGSRVCTAERHLFHSDNFTVSFSLVRYKSKFSTKS